MAEQTIRNLQDGMTIRMRALIHSANLLAQTPNQTPKKLEKELSSIVGMETLHFFAVSRGTEFAVQEGELSRFLGEKPSATDTREIFNHTVERLELSPKNSLQDYRLTTGVHRTNIGPYAYAIGRSNLIDGELPNTFIMIRGLGETVTRSLMARFGLDVIALSPNQFRSELISNNATEKQRNHNNHIYMYIRGDNGHRSLPIRISTPERRFDDRILTPTIVFAFVFTLLFWLVTLFVVNVYVLKPITSIAKQLRHIRLSSNYRQLLIAENGSEMKGLVKECNNLLLHVADQTEELENHSFRDALTYIANRRQLDISLLHAWSNGKRSRHPLSVIIFDLDYFKQYNDIYGHSAGDKALKQFADVLTEVFDRSNDTIGRSGGEEFMAILEDTDETSALALALRVIKLLRQRSIRHVGSRTEECLTVTAGVASIIPSDEDSKESLTQRADKAMYIAKSAGRNRAQLYSGTTKTEN